MPPIVILSGESDPDVHARFMEAGAAKVLLKPASQEALRGLRAIAASYKSARSAAGIVSVFPLKVSVRA